MLRVIMKRLNKVVVILTVLGFIMVNINPAESISEIGRVNKERVTSHDLMPAQPANPFKPVADYIAHPNVVVESDSKVKPPMSAQEFKEKLQKIIGLYPVDPVEPRVGVKEARDQAIQDLFDELRRRGSGEGWVTYGKEEPPMSAQEFKEKLQKIIEQYYINPEARDQAIQDLFDELRRRGFGEEERHFGPGYWIGIITDPNATPEQRRQAAQLLIKLLRSGGNIDGQILVALISIITPEGSIFTDRQRLDAAFLILRYIKSSLSNDSWPDTLTSLVLTLGYLKDFIQEALNNPNYTAEQKAWLVQGFGAAASQVLNKLRGEGDASLYASALQSIRNLLNAALGNSDILVKAQALHAVMNLASAIGFYNQEAANEISNLLNNVDANLVNQLIAALGSGSQLTLEQKGFVAFVLVRLVNTKGSVFTGDVFDKTLGALIDFISSSDWDSLSEHMRGYILSASARIVYNNLGKLNLGGLFSSSGGGDRLFQFAGLIIGKLRTALTNEGEVEVMAIAINALVDIYEWAQRQGENALAEQVATILSSVTLPTTGLDASQLGAHKTLVIARAIVRLATININRIQMNDLIYHYLEPIAALLLGNTAFQSSSEYGAKDALRQALRDLAKAVIDNDKSTESFESTLRGLLGQIIQLPGDSRITGSVAATIEEIAGWISQKYGPERAERFRNPPPPI